MRDPHAALADRIRAELGDLQQSVSLVTRAVEAARRHTPDQDLYLHAAALNLHGFYGGLERLFQRIAELLDGAVPSGSEWHQALLQRMGANNPPIRPPVLSSATVSSIGEYMRFRHVVRNIYADLLIPERIEELADGLPSLVRSLQVDLSAFADFLSHLPQDG